MSEMLLVPECFQGGDESSVDLHSRYFKRLLHDECKGRIAMYGLVTRQVHSPITPHYLSVLPQTVKYIRWWTLSRILVYLSWFKPHSNSTDLKAADTKTTLDFFHFLKTNLNILFARRDSVLHMVRVNVYPSPV